MYYGTVKKKNYKILLNIVEKGVKTLLYTWRISITVSTQDFHSWNRSSTLLYATTVNDFKFKLSITKIKQK